MITKQYPRAYLYKRVVDAKLFIDQNYAAKIDLDAIAVEACFSKFHFIRLFKTVYGKTPHHYLTGVRINKAIELFRVNDSVREVCEAVGFDSLSSFSGLFKRVVGASPATYLVRQRAIKIKLINHRLLLFRAALYFSTAGPKIAILEKRYP